MNVIGQIVTGHVNEALGLNKDISVERMKICKRCPLYKASLGGICNPKLWLNPKTGDVTSIKRVGYYKGCGCRLSAKTTLPTAHCPANKW